MKLSGIAPRKRLWLGAIFVLSLGLLVLGLTVVWPHLGRNDQEILGTWVTVGPASDLEPGNSLSVTIGKGRVLLINDKGTVAAFHGRCPRLGAHLSWDAHNQQIICPKGGRFSAKGERLSGPPPSDLAKYRVRTIAGQVEVWCFRLPE